MSNTDQVTLAVPAKPQFIRLARVTASGLATRLGFGIDDIEDLRLAVDEACFCVMGTGLDNHELCLTYRVDDQSLTVDGKITSTEAITPPSTHEMTHLILDALVDEHTIEHRDNESVFHFTKAAHT